MHAPIPPIAYASRHAAMHRTTFFSLGGVSIHARKVSLPKSYRNSQYRFLHYSPIRQNDQHRVHVDGATELSHAHFIANASPTSDFNPAQKPTAGLDPSPSSSSSTTSSSASLQGKLSPTNSHLFKLILPLPSHSKTAAPTAFLLHPSQPLSHLSRLIIGSLPPSYREAEINYLALTGQESDLDSHLRHAEEQEQETGREEGGPYLTERKRDQGRWQEVSWSQSTDLSDFIKQSCLNEKFKIVITPYKDGDVGVSDKQTKVTGRKSEVEGMTMEVIIPSFASRTEYIRSRLLTLTKQLDRMTKAKKQIDYTAHKGAQKLAIAALGGGVLYWGTVIRYTFFTSAGWDLMEPVTWATGFAALLSSAAFLIYHNREVSYSSLLDLSISARQRKLYAQHGLDIERWTEMVSEAKTLRKEITRIAADYDIEWTGELENLGNTSPAPSRSGKSNSKSTSSDASDSPSEGGEAEEEGKLDIDKTIDEASELAMQTEEKKNKEKAAQRKGQVMETDEGDNSKSNGTSKHRREGDDRENKSQVKGRERAEEVVDKQRKR